MAAGANRNRRISVLVGALVLTACTANAAAVRVGTGGRFPTIASGLASAQSGDTVLVAPGLYKEYGLVIDKPVVLAGVDRPVIDANNQGEIFTITANGVTVTGLVLKNVGTSYIQDRAAIRLKNVEGGLIEGNEFDNAFFGIYAEHSHHFVIRANRLIGPATSETTSGNGIHLWYCKDARIENNEIRGHRDGIYFEFVENSLITGNLSTHNIRYGLHFMFSHGNSYIANRFMDNGAGVAVMFTERIVMRDNVFEHNWGPSSYGLLLKDIRDSEIRHNQFIGNTVGLYAEGSERLTVEENEFVDNGYAVRILANSMDNTFTRNNFLGNGFDVVTNSRQSHNTFADNYWSEYTGYDLDQDGVGDVPYHPVRLFSLLAEKAPSSIMLMGSLFVTLIDTAERAMPVFTPETLVDNTPRMEMITAVRNSR
jgi:nitrous oxidase accessory protein